jgi:hypothetical protein
MNRFKDRVSPIVSLPFISLGEQQQQSKQSILRLPSVSPVAACHRAHYWDTRLRRFPFRKNL